MGAFYLARKPSPGDAYQKPLAVFAEAGLRLHREFHSEDFDLYVFHKREFDVENVVELENGDFVCVTGTLIYKHLAGTAALEALYHDFDPETGAPDEQAGSFCAVLKKGGSLHLFGDYTGYYRIYTDSDRRVFSSSFLATVRSLDKTTVATQELYEYVLRGGTYGDRTVFEEVEMIDSTRYFTLGSVLSSREKPLSPQHLSPGAGRAQMIDEVVERQIEYFEDIRQGFGSALCSALSGGYDSRLMLALLRKVGIDDAYLYVYGAKSSSDVRVARGVAEGMGLTLHHSERIPPESFTPETYDELLRRQFYVKDGLPSLGIFDDGMDLASRVERIAKAPLQLNGSGGETYRDRWLLRDRAVSSSDLILSKYERPTPGVVEAPFVEKEFLAGMARKMRAVLDTEDPQTPAQIARLFIFYQMKYAVGLNHSLNCRLGHALLPLADQRLVWQTFGIPMKWKQLGRFQASLIDAVEPALARYPSNYGHNFVDPVPLRRRLKVWGKSHLPVALRPLARRYGSGEAKLIREGGRLPDYLKKDFRARMGLSEDLAVSRYVNVDRMVNARMLSRALSLEVLLRERY